MTNKYPNADTSPERLAEIQGQFSDGYDLSNDAICDLLAMLHERADYKREYTKVVEAASVFQAGGPLAYLMQLGQSTTLEGPKLAAEEITRLKQQLHEQRWRRVHEEIPINGEVVQVGFLDSFGKLLCAHENWDDDSIHHWKYWRPIPPLPKE